MTWGKDRRLSPASAAAAAAASTVSTVTSSAAATSIASGTRGTAAPTAITSGNGGSSSGGGGSHEDQPSIFTAISAAVSSRSRCLVLVRHGIDRRAIVVLGFGLLRTALATETTHSLDCTTNFDSVGRSNVISSYGSKRRSRLFIKTDDINDLQKKKIQKNMAKNMIPSHF